jgi:general secretion pathway protein D
MMRLLLAVLVVSAGCAQHSAHREALDLLDAGEIEAGLRKLQEASAKDPRNIQLRQGYFLQRDIAVERYVSQAETARLRGQWNAAEDLYERALRLNPENARVLAGIAGLGRDRKHRNDLNEAERLLKGDAVGAAESTVRAILAENPNNREAQHLLRRIEERMARFAGAPPGLSAKLRQPVTLQFAGTSLRHIFEAISRATGLNFILDKEVRAEERASIFVRNSSVEDVLGFLLVSHQLEKKVLSENTLLIYPNTPAKLRDYQDLIVRSFYLANADAKATAAMIKTLVKTKDIHIDEKLNLIVIRDTPHAVRMAERLVASQDLREAEVMLEVEILEVGASRLQELGIRYPGSLSVGVVGAAGIPGTVTLSELKSGGSDVIRISISDPFLALNLRNELGRSNLLANPRIRVKNKEKARIHIGDKVPVITTTSTATGFASESVSYLDVGLKLEVEPVISLDDEVGIKVGLEVSNIVREIRGGTGALTYQVGTRSAATTLRLKDGETQILAGLISDEDRKTVNQIPGIGDLPVVGRLFGSHLDSTSRNEIVLLITPRIIRNLSRPAADIVEFPSGTDAAVGAPPVFLRGN